MAKKLNRYSALVEKIFFDSFQQGQTVIEFAREDIESAARDLGIDLPKNIGDVLYSFRFRAQLPDRILATQPEGKEWLIALAGRAKYNFKLATLNRIVPNENLATIAVPDATPEIIRGYALDDEQALLAIVRYNRLLDIFLGITTYSLQNHLRTTVPSIGQIEIDELYIGIDKHGCHYVIPVQAKGGSDRISVVQTEQDLAWCKERFPDMRAKAISVQFIGSDTTTDKVAFFELTFEDAELKVAEERHFRLVSHDSIDPEAIVSYRD